MYTETKLRRSGGSTAVTLPKHMLERFNLKADDEVIAVETDEGILIVPSGSTVARALAIAQRGSERFRNALRELGG